MVGGFDADHAACVGVDAGNGVQIDAGGQGVALLVVGVVPAQLRAARAGEQRRRGAIIGPIEITKAAYQCQQPPGRPGGAVPVDTAQLLVTDSILQRCDKLSDRLQSHPSSAQRLDLSYFTTPRLPPQQKGLF